MGISNFVTEKINWILNLGIEDIAMYGVWGIVAIITIIVFLILKHFHRHYEKKENGGHIDECCDGQGGCKDNVPEAGKLFSVRKFLFIFVILLLFLFVVAVAANQSFGKLPLLFVDAWFTFEWFLSSVVLCVSAVVLINFSTLYDNVKDSLQKISQCDKEMNENNDAKKILLPALGEFANILNIKIVKGFALFLCFSLFAGVFSWWFPKEYSDICDAMDYLHFEMWAPFCLALFIALVPWIVGIDIGNIPNEIGDFFKHLFGVIFEIYNKMQKDSDSEVPDKSNGKDFLYSFLSKFLRCFILPFKFFLTITFIKVALVCFPVHFFRYDGWIRIVFHLIIQLTFYWLLWRLVDKKMGILTPIFERCNFGDLAESYVGIVSPVLKILIFIFGGTFALQEIGIDMSVAFKTLSIGSTLAGAAIAWVSSSSLSNMVSGMVLIMDKPFSEGDWVIIGDVEGEVEKITFRCTKIRKFSQELVEIPNSKVAELPITNVRRIEEKRMRRVESSFNIDYFVKPNVLKEALEEIKKELEIYRDNIMEKHKELQNTIFDRDNNEKRFKKIKVPRVYFSEFQDFAARVDVVLYIPVTDYIDFLEHKNEINLKIIEILDRHKIKIAVPVLKRAEVRRTKD